MNAAGEVRTDQTVRTSRPRVAPLADQQGFSVLELLFVLALGVTLSAMAAPSLAGRVDDVRVAGAVRYVTTLMQRTRMEAVQRSANVGIQFVQVPSGYAFGSYADGNGNGVRTTEIKSGVDPLVRRTDTLASQFPGVDFGVLPNLPAIDSGSAPPGTDPIKLGTSNILSFTALGSATAGSVYILGRNKAQYAIRIVGETGKLRILKFDSNSRRWLAQ